MKIIRNVEQAEKELERKINNLEKNRRREKIEDRISFFLIFILYFLSIILIFLFLIQINFIKLSQDFSLSFISSMDNEISESDNPNIFLTNGCYNLSAKDTSLCLRDNLATFWFYNHSQVGKELTFEEIKQDGGVCKHASDLYYNAIKELGFYVEKPIIGIDKDTAHSFVIISGTVKNESAWCFIDQLKLGCISLD